MENNLEFGQVKISTDVISSIVAIAIEEIEGAKVHAHSFVDKVMPKNISSKVVIEGDEVIVSESVSMKYGLNIIETVNKIQENISSSISAMTGLTVKKVNIEVSELV